MDFTLQDIAGIVAATIGFYASLLYILSILGRGISILRLRIYRLTERTKPNRVTWFIWTFVGAITVTSYYAAGATDTVWVPAILTLEYAVTAILSIWYGEGGSWRQEKKQMRRDVFCLLGAVISAIAWWWFETPEIALFATIAIDSFGAFPTIVKAYKAPQTENKLSWTLTALSSVINMLAVEWRWEVSTITIAAYPLYMLIANSMIASFLYRGHLPGNPLIRRNR